MARAARSKPRPSTPAAPASTSIPPAPPPLKDLTPGPPHPAAIEYPLDGPLDRPEALATEWLLADGQGGFAMGAASGVPGRRYHALLIRATRPPVGRVALLNATVDQLIVAPATPQALPIDLSSFRFAGLDRIHPDGAARAAAFRKNVGFVEWTFITPVARITRRLQLRPSGGGAILHFRVERRHALPPGTPAPALRLSIRPLVTLRDMHWTTRRSSAQDLWHRAAHNIPACEWSRGGLHLTIRADGGRFVEDPQWWHDFLYVHDQARGQDCIEDLYSAGVFEIDLAPDREVAELTLNAHAGAVDAPDLGPLDLCPQAAQLGRATEHARSIAPALTPEQASWVARLVAAGNDFVVARAPTADAPGGASIIAGYPWFSDWGRDTFISLPGLLIATGRFDEARATLMAFAARRKGGLIPNVFNDQTGEAEYNTVDGSLWFIQAACAYLAATSDRSTWNRHLAPACLDIIAHYRRGTDFNIAMDPLDKLITAGTAATQLTWMDARRDGVTFTPRHGKAVEINALWISGLHRLAGAIAPDNAIEAANLHDLAEAAGRSFRQSFWNPAANCLFDCLTPHDRADSLAWEPDPSIRPNQVFAVSLPYSPLSPDQQHAVLACLRSRLLTPRGLRTLDPADPAGRYRPRYEGDMFSRDGAYHQGTAWPWLLGPMAEAILRAGEFSAEARREAIDVLRPMLSLLEPGAIANPENAGLCAGHLAEIYDGSAPQRPQGCPAQAWSVAEMLRVLLLAAG